MFYDKEDEKAFLRLLEAHFVTSWLPRIIKQLRVIRQKREGIMNVMIKSARPLSLVQKKEVLNLTANALPAGKHLEADFFVDPMLIGGFHVESREIVIQGSVKDALERMLTG